MMTDYAGLDATLADPPLGWYRLGVAPGPGTLLAGSIGATPVVGWLGADGRPAAAVGICAHLGAELVTGDVVEGCVRCPFHGWRYDAAGGHAGTPDGAVVPGAGLAVLACRRVGEDLYAFWAAGRDVAPWEPLGLRWAEEAGAVAADPATAVETRVIDRDMGAPPVIVAEGAFDVAHFAEVHKVAPGDVDYAFEGRVARIAFTVGEGRTAFRFTFEMDGLTSLQETVTRDRYQVQRVFSLYSTPGGWRSRVVSTGSGPRAKAVAAFLDQLERAAMADLEEDADLWAHRRFTLPSVYGPADRPLREFRAWALPFLAVGPGQ